MKFADHISLCVVLKDDSGQIEEFLESVLLASEGAPLAEIVLVDNASVDGTLEKAQDWLSSHVNESMSYKILRLSQSNIGLARATAVSMCTHAWVAFLEADVRPEKNWFSKILRTAETCPMQNTLAAVGGKTLPCVGGASGILKGISLIDERAWSLSASQPFAAREYLRTVAHKPICNILYRKEALLKVGNFSFKLAEAGEDLEITARLVQRGFQIWSDPEAVVYRQSHQGQDTWRSFTHWVANTYKAGRWQWVVIQKYPMIFGLRHLAAIMTPFFLVAMLLLNWKITMQATFAILLASLFVAAWRVGKNAGYAVSAWLVKALFFSLGLYGGLLQWFVFCENLKNNLSPEGGLIMPKIQKFQTDRSQLS